MSFALRAPGCNGTPWLPVPRDKFDPLTSGEDDSPVTEPARQATGRRAVVTDAGWLRRIFKAPLGAGARSAVVDPLPSCRQFLATRPSRARTRRSVGRFRR